MTDWGDRSGICFLQNARSGHVAMAVPSWPMMTDDGEPEPMWLLVRPSGQDRMRDRRLTESAWRKIDKDRCEAAWETEAIAFEKRIDLQTINLVTGLLLPVWNRLPDEDVRVWRVTDESGTGLLGRMVTPAGLEKLGSAFGVKMAMRLTSAEIIDAARAGGSPAIPGLEGASLVRVRVNDAMRLEIRAFPPASREQLKSLGCFTEVIAFKTRLFIPSDRAVAVLDSLCRQGTEGARTSDRSAAAA